MTRLQRMRLKRRFNFQLIPGTTSSATWTWSIRYRPTSTKPRLLIVAGFTYRLQLLQELYLSLTCDWCSQSLYCSLSPHPIPGKEGQFKVLISYKINGIDIFKHIHLSDRSSQYYYFVRNFWYAYRSWDTKSKYDVDGALRCITFFLERIRDIFRNSWFLSDEKRSFALWLKRWLNKLCA